MLRADLQEERSAAQRQGPAGGGAALVPLKDSDVRGVFGSALSFAHLEKPEEVDRTSKWFLLTRLHAQTQQARIDMDGDIPLYIPPLLKTISASGACRSLHIRYSLAANKNAKHIITMIYLITRSLPESILVAAREVALQHVCT